MGLSMTLVSDWIPWWQDSSVAEFHSHWFAFSNARSRRAPIVVLQPAEGAFSNRRAGQAEEDARQMLRHRVEPIALAETVDPLVTAPNAAREAGKEERQVDIHRRAQPKVPEGAVATTEGVAIQHLLQERAMRSHQALAALRASSHRRGYRRCISAPVSMGCSADMVARSVVTYGPRLFLFREPGVVALNGRADYSHPLSL